MSARSDATGVERRAWPFISAFNFLQKTLIIKGTNLLLSNLLEKPLSSLSLLFIVFLRVSFFFFLLITTSVHSKDGKEFSIKEKTVKLFQSQQGWITRKPLDSTVAPTQSF